MASRAHSQLLRILLFIGSEQRRSDKILEWWEKARHDGCAAPPHGCSEHTEHRTHWTRAANYYYDAANCLQNIDWVMHVNVNDELESLLFRSMLSVQVFQVPTNKNVNWCADIANKRPSLPPSRDERERTNEPERNGTERNEGTVSRCEVNIEVVRKRLFAECIWYVQLTMVLMVSLNLSGLHVGRSNNNNNNNGTIIIMIIKQFESHAIASSSRLHCRSWCPLPRSYGLYPQWDCLNGHNHNRKCVCDAESRALLVRFLRLVDWVLLVSVFDDWPVDTGHCVQFQSNTYTV